jgi:hypothetical protein
MKPISHIMVVLAFAVGGTVAQAAVTAKLDRNRVALGETLRLTITATEDEELDDADLRALLRDFDIVQRSSSSNTSIVNGRMSHARQVIIDLTPTRQGNLQIPSMHVGQSTTPSLPVVVSAAPDSHTGDQSVVFEAEVDQHKVYVQGQVILTLRVQQAVNLEEAGIAELKLDNAFVKPLEQRSFQRTIDGSQWLVHELRYAIFPEQSGTLQIPAQVFSGRLEQGRRSFFDLGRGGKLVRRSTQAISIDVLPKPDSFTADTWLPSRQLTLQENWSTSPDHLRVGESATRTIRIQGEGLQGAQLPPILFVPTDGLKYYPDQPLISEEEIPDGLMGIRQDSAAVVPVRAGTYLIPEIRIPWWNTETEQVQYAVLPARKITVTASEPASTPTEAATPSPADETAPSAAISVAVPPASPGQAPVWQILSAVSTLGWLTTLFYLWRQRGSGAQESLVPADNTSEKLAFKKLVAACSGGDAAGARAAVIAWATALRPDAPVVSLEQVATRFGDGEMTRELNQLDARLYSPEQVTWDGAGLAECARRLRGDDENGARSTMAELRLYPVANS